MKKGEFFWTPAARKVFEEIKKKLVEALVLCHLDLLKDFEVACDASRVGIVGVLSQDDHPIVYFNEMLNEAKKRYSKYDKEFYVVVP